MCTGIRNKQVIYNYDTDNLNNCGSCHISVVYATVSIKNIEEEKTSEFIAFSASQSLV